MCAVLAKERGIGKRKPLIPTINKAQTPKRTPACRGGEEGWVVEVGVCVAYGTFFGYTRSICITLYSENSNLRKTDFLSLKFVKRNYSED